MIRNKKVVETTDADGKQLVLAIVKPSVKLKDDSEKVYAKRWRESAENGYFLSARILDEAKKLGVWGPAQDAELENIDARLEEGRLKLLKGGIPLWGLEVESLQSIAIGMLKDRSERIRVYNGVNSLIEKTAESYAETYRFNFLVAKCTVYQEDQKPYFKGEDDYILRYEEKVTQDVTVAAQEFLYDFGDPIEAQKKLPEFVAMLKYGLCNEKLQLINKEGKLIARNGRLIDDEGFYLDKDGNRPVENIEFIPFLDENGNPIVEATDENQS